MKLNIIQIGGKNNSVQGCATPLETPAESNMDCSNSKAIRNTNLFQSNAGSYLTVRMALYAVPLCGNAIKGKPTTSKAQQFQLYSPYSLLYSVNTFLEARTSPALVFSVYSPEYK